MGSKKGKYTVPSGTLYEEARGWTGFLLSAGSPILDVVLNSISDALGVFQRRVTQTYYPPAGSPFGKVHIAEATTYGTSDNLKITGGDGTFADTVVYGDVTDGVVSKGPGRFYLGGHLCIFPSDREWLDNSKTLPAIHSTTTAINGDAIVDSSAFFGVDGDTLVGRICYPDITLINDATSSGPLGFPIVSVNDQTTLTLDLADPRNADGSIPSAGDVDIFSNLDDYGVTVGNQYKIAISTPGGSRTDTVIIDCYEDEVTPDEDPVLLRVIEGTSTKGGNVKKLAQRIEILENINLTSSVMPSPYYYITREDADGNTHHRAVLATITRSAASVLTANITTYNSSTTFNASPQLAPPIGTDSAIQQALGGGQDWNTYGSQSIPGKWLGSSFKLTNFLFQSLGNISSAINTAMQNAGVYKLADASLRRLTPGIGTTASNTGHVSLVTNDEEGSFRYAYPGSGTSTSFTLSALSPSNPPLSLTGHNSAPTLSTATALTNIARHAILKTGSSLISSQATKYKKKNDSSFTTGQTFTYAELPVFALGQAGSILAMGYGVATPQVVTNDYNAVDTYATLTIPIANIELDSTTFSTKAQLTNRYYVVVWHSLPGFGMNDQQGPGASGQYKPNQISWDVGAVTGDTAGVSRILVTVTLDTSSVSVHSTPFVSVHAFLIAI